MNYILKLNNANASDQELIDDLKQVAKEINKVSITQTEYNKVGRYSSATIKNRFGWNNALEKAGLTITKYQNISDEDLIDDLKRVALLIIPQKVTTSKYNEKGKYTSAVIDKRFGWNNALLKAGLEISNQQNISNNDLYENIEELWIKLGRQPNITECVKPFSKYSSDTYKRRFGTWRKALESFITYINSDDNNTANITVKKKVLQIDNGYKHLTKRYPDNRLKLKVMWRDGNVCKLCGVKLSVWEEGHFDHITPWAKGGETILENLQILCAKCNQVKGDLDLQE